MGARFIGNSTWYQSLDSEGEARLHEIEISQ
jgi:hypothetical protein